MSGRLVLTPTVPADYLEAVASVVTQPGLFIETPETYAHLVTHNGRGFTGRIDGQLAGCAGIVRQWAGVGIAWAIITAFGRLQAPRACHYAIRAGLYRLAREMAFRRVEATVIADFEVGRRWVELLGFREESVLPLYGPRGETHIRYVYFPKETP